MVSLEKITTDGKALFLAYDQGLEHGPIDFTDDTIDPGHVLKVGVYGDFNGVIVQKGVAEKYYDASPFKQAFIKKLPLVVKLNGKTSFFQDEPYSPQLCTVAEALQLGAVAVGYTVYVGSAHEAQMMEEFSAIIRDAHAEGVPVIGWMYPRGKATVDHDKAELTAYAARIGMEIGADMVKLQYPGSKEAVHRAVTAAGATKVVISGGEKQDREVFFTMVHDVMAGGAAGLAVGRNIWQDSDPIVIAKQIKKIIWPNKGD